MKLLSFLPSLVFSSTIQPRGLVNLNKPLPPECAGWDLNKCNDYEPCNANFMKNDCSQCQILKTYSDHALTGQTQAEAIDLEGVIKPCSENIMRFTFTADLNYDTTKTYNRRLIQIGQNSSSRHPIDARPSIWITSDNRFMFLHNQWNGHLEDQGACRRVKKKNAKNFFRNFHTF